MISAHVRRAACVLRRTQLEAKQRLQLAETSFRPYISADAAAGSATRMPGVDAGAARGDGQRGVAPEADDDDELGCSDDELCEAVDLADSDSSEGSEDSEDSEDDC